MKVPPQCPPTEPSLPPDRHRGLRPSQHQTHPAVPLPKRWSPPTLSMASRNPTPTASPSSGRTWTESIAVAASPQTGCWSQPACGLCLWGAPPQGTPHDPLPTPLWFLLSHERLPAPHRSWAYSRVPWMRGPLSLGPAPLQLSCQTHRPLSGRHVGATTGGGTLPPLCPFFLSPSWVPPSPSRTSPLPTPPAVH